MESVSSTCLEVARCQVVGLAERLRTELGRRELTLRRVSRLCGWAPDFLGRVLRGKPKLRFEHLYRVLAVLHERPGPFFQRALAQPAEDAARGEDTGEAGEDGRDPPAAELVALGPRRTARSPGRSVRTVRVEPRLSPGQRSKLVAALVRSRVRARGIPLRQVSRCLGRTPGYASRLFRRRTDFTVELALALLAACEVSATGVFLDLHGGAPPPSSRRAAGRPGVLGGAALQTLDKIMAVAFEGVSKSEFLEGMGRILSESQR